MDTLFNLVYRLKSNMIAAVKREVLYAYHFYDRDDKWGCWTVPIMTVFITFLGSAFVIVTTLIGALLFGGGGWGFTALGFIISLASIGAIVLLPHMRDVVNKLDLSRFDIIAWAKRDEKPKRKQRSRLELSQQDEISEEEVDIQVPHQNHKG